MKRAFQVPQFMFALCGQHEDFEAAKRVLGIPVHRRPVILEGNEYHFFRASSADNELWPTTGELAQYNIRVYAEGQYIWWNEEE